MKKRTTLTIITLIMIITLVGCGKGDNSNNETSNINNDAQKEEVVTYDFTERPDFEDDEKFVEEYQQQLSERSVENFFTEEEEAFFREKGYTIGEDCVSKYDSIYNEIYVYARPILYTSNDGTEVEMWYTTEYGELCQRNVIGRYMCEYHGSIHCERAENEVEIEATEGYSIIYAEETGHVSVWSLGELLREYDLPKGSVYTGFSAWTGYIFRHGTDVYALKEYGMANNGEDCTLEVIAHDVKQVVMANYYLTSDEWSNPLFLMTDGTLKAYSDWRGEENSKPDDTSHLTDVIYEGGYDK